MIRWLLMALLLVATARDAAPQEALAHSPRLKELVAVTAEVVRIGDLVDDAGPAAGIAVFRAPDLGGGVKTAGTPRLMTQGTLSPTGADLNVAIRGEGFFKVLMPDGTFTYTRDGPFQMDAQGRIVTSQGNVVQPGISIPTNAQAISISPQGQVSATLPTSSSPSILGQLALTRFVNKAGLQAIGDNLFVETPASGTPQDGVPNTDGYGDVQQGNLEQANVEAVTEISDLIAAQRAYEMNGKVITAADQMLSATSNLMR